MSLTAFRQALSADDRRDLKHLIQSACQPVPADYLPLLLQGSSVEIGYLSRAHCLALQPLLDLQLTASACIWQVANLTIEQRNERLAHAAAQLHAQQLIGSWRSELYSCWGPVADSWPYAKPEIFRMERAAFRFFGLRSHAVHVHGFTANGHMWVGKRAISKATDPGKLDNLAAGGLPVDEQLEECAIREIWEEAGLSSNHLLHLTPMADLVTERTEPEGWHSERLFVYSVEIQTGIVPANQDGEVSEFLHLSPEQVMQKIRNQEFSPDAAVAIAAITLA
jgi:8-oxo-dGTP pyrophosphatase MutT (NUDIX family)